MTSFLLNYQGNKWNESKYLKDLDYSPYDTIIEPFGGSFGFSRYLHEKLKLKDKKYIIYDNNKELIDFYNYIKELIHEDTFNDFLDQYNNIAEKLIEQFTTGHGGQKRNQVKKKECEEYILNEESIPIYIKYILLHNLLSCHISRVYMKKNIGFQELFKSSEFIHCNFEDLDFKIYNKEKTLIYLDPPYILEHNDYYKSVDESFSYYEKLINLFETNICLFIHSYLGLLDFVFRKYKYMNYGKLYQNHNNQKIHIVYYNPKIE
tara:strand:+ start:12526 stop:13314 length:789 start_codon:yes stop_codon:yes gene_type:complete